MYGPHLSWENVQTETWYTRKCSDGDLVDCMPWCHVGAWLICCSYVTGMGQRSLRGSAERVRGRGWVMGGGWVGEREWAWVGEGAQIEPKTCASSCFACMRQLGKCQTTLWLKRDSALNSSSSAAREKNIFASEVSVATAALA